MQERQPFISIDSLLCIQQNPPVKVCMSQNCKYNAFICKDSNCICQKQRHIGCQMGSIDQLILLLSQHQIPITEDIQHVIDKMENAYDKMLDQISQSRLKFLEDMDAYGLKPLGRSLMKMITTGQQHFIDGDLISKVVGQFQQDIDQMSISRIQINQLEQKIKKSLQNLMKCYEEIFLGAFQLDFKHRQRFIQFVSDNSKPICDENWNGKYSAQEWLNQSKPIGLIQNFSLVQIPLPLGIPPQLQLLPGLVRLKICQTSLSKIENLDTLHKLKCLKLSNNKIKRIENLQKLTNIEQLNLGWNEIQMIENLETLDKLRDLHLNGNKITKIFGLQALKKLQILSLTKNKIQVIENLQNLTSLKKLLIYSNPLKLTSLQKKLLDKLVNIGAEIHLYGYEQFYQPQKVI